jgi:phenylpropionate dioxygenase-like ring-hydroxylating dioxygenase large terminal subunit
MNDASPPQWPAVRADYIPAAHYTSPDFLRLEDQHVWPKVWQIACREQDVREPGSYCTYDIMGDSIIVARTLSGELRAMHNVCSHRGRRLVSGSGMLRQFFCPFHGWRYELDGSIAAVLDRQDWNGCPNFSDDALSLPPVRVDTWGGWVFVAMDPDAEPLRDFLDPVPRYLDCYELETMSYRWHATVKIACNWKVAIEAFNEAYHAFATHPQLMANYGDDRTSTKLFGRHAKFYFEPNPEFPIGAPSPRLGKNPPADLRQNMIDYFELYNNDLAALFCERDVEATRRLLSEVDASASGFEVMTKAMEFQREAAIAAGVGFPEVTMQQIGDAATDWHVFPNHVFLPGPTGLLGYRALPHPTVPDCCYFDVYSLQRYAPGYAPQDYRKLFLGDEDWREFRSVSRILQQDIDNMMEVQKGLHSRAFRGARTNPVQEAPVSNFHQTLLDYIAAGEGG